MKMSLKKAQKMRTLFWQYGGTYRKIGEEHGLTESHARQIINNEMWKDEWYQKYLDTLKHN